MQQLVEERLHCRLGSKCFLSIYESQSHLHAGPKDLNSSQIFSSVDGQDRDLDQVAAISLSAAQRFQLLQQQTQKTLLKSLNHLLYHHPIEGSSAAGGINEKACLYVFPCKGSQESQTEFICCFLAINCALNTLKQVTNRHLRSELEEMLQEMTK